MSAADDITPRLSLVTVLKGAGFTFLGTMLGRVLVFVAKAIIGDDVGPDLFGLFNIGFSSLVLLQFLTLGGFYEGISTFISTYRAENKPAAVSRALFTGVTVGTAFGLVLGVLVYLAADNIATGLFGDPRLGDVFRMIGILLPLHCVSQVVLGCLRGLKQIRRMVTARNLFGDLGLIIAVLVVSALGMTVIRAFATLAVKHLLIIATGAWFIARGELAATFRRHPTRSFDGPLVRYSIPVTASLTLETVRLYAETLLLGALIGSEQVGYFSTALLISSLLLILGAAFRPILLPVIAELHVGQRGRDVFRIYITVVKYVAFFATPCALTLLFFPGAVIRLVFNDSFLEATLALRILGAAYFVSACIGNYTAILYATGGQRLDLAVKTAGTVTSLGLNLVLIPTYGLTGAAVAHAISLLTMELLGAALAVRGQKLLPRAWQPLKVMLFSAVVFILEVIAVGLLVPDFGQQARDVPLIALLVVINYAIGMRFVPLDEHEREILARARARIGGERERE
jgi:O-antigen/teichoic acid export membrane protein